MRIDIEEQYDRIYRYCYFKMQDAHTAEDITQETFLRFLESRSYRDLGRPLAYLYRIAGNLCMDEFRSRMRAQRALQARALDSEPVGDTGYAGYPEGAAESFEHRTVERLALDTAMQELSEEERELLLLRFVNEVPMGELAAMYGRSRFALRRTLTKITEKLERRLSDG